MDGRLTRTNFDKAGDFVVPYLLSPRDLVSRPDNMDETVLSSEGRLLRFLEHQNQSEHHFDTPYLFGSNFKVHLCDKTA